jgi:GT2 family glycosyltransferase
VLILNNDTVVAPDFAAEALDAVRSHPDAVVAGCVLDADTGRPSYNIGILSPWTGLVRDVYVRDFEGTVDFVSGCMMFVPAEVFRKVGLFDERYFMYREDFDFCLRLKERGIGIVYRPAILIRHKVSSATDRTGTPKEYYRMRNQTRIILERATFFNKACYFVFIACLLAYKTRHPGVLREFISGIRDAFSEKLGRRVKDKPVRPIGR